MQIDTLRLVPREKKSSRGWPPSWSKGAASRDVALPAAPEQRAARRARYLGDSAVKLPPSSSRILQNRTPLTKGTEESSSSSKSTLNLNFFFFIIMRARRRRAGCGGGPKGRAGRRRRFNSVEPRARAAPWPEQRAARGGAAGGRRGPAAAASSCGNLGPSAAAAAARTPPARGEWLCCSSPERWEPFPCAACRRRRRRPSGRRGEAGRTAAAAASSVPRAQRRPQRPLPTAHRRAEVGRAREAIRGGRALRRETDPRRQLGCHASLGFKKKKKNPTKKELPSTPSSRPFFSYFAPPPFSPSFFSDIFFPLGLRVMG